ncbi:Cyclophilin-like domain,Cyclophilin-type peptidyl-prolyl cis-trans isomerase domain [Cinara cedri]|uniref:Cyclophilin-like domain,Cyclophilin-type peptidyl-prolyl cis-trans isomerase domain n=1 Tax=Cinara cedri TaxID=506608 RepID=A0A5E4M9V8_9HEMI|nr:Cyclophilin-like domain,Cyclophilin-type peptidyl-prolyl cis-trans isomerase domain [Cinara cedri]
MGPECAFSSSEKYTSPMEGIQSFLRLKGKAHRYRAVMRHRGGGFHKMLLSSKYVSVLKDSDDLIMILLGKLNVLKHRPDLVNKYTVKGVMDFEWTRYLWKLNQSLGGVKHHNQDTVAIFIDKYYIGTYDEFINYLSTEYNFIISLWPLKYKRLIWNDIQNYYDNHKLTFVRMVFDVNNWEIGHIVFALFEKLVPKTCEYFRQLCLNTTDGYTNSSIHRIDVINGFIQAGRIFTRTAYLKKENYLLKHDRRGMLSFVNKHKYFNGPEFVISLQPNSWMNDEYVAFGYAVDGEQTLKYIEKFSDTNESLNQQIRITSCNVIVKTMDSLHSNTRSSETEIESFLSSIIHTGILKSMYINVYGKPEPLHKPLLSEYEYMKSIVMIIMNKVWNKTIYSSSQLNKVWRQNFYSNSHVPQKTLTSNTSSDWDTTNEIKSIIKLRPYSNNVDRNNNSSITASPITSKSILLKTKYSNKTTNGCYISLPKKHKDYRRCKQIYESICK